MNAERGGKGAEGFSHVFVSRNLVKFFKCPKCEKKSHKYITNMNNKI